MCSDVFQLVDVMFKFLGLTRRFKSSFRKKVIFGTGTDTGGIFIFGANAIAPHFPEKMISVLMPLGGGLLSPGRGYACQAGTIASTHLSEDAR